MALDPGLPNRSESFDAASGRSVEINAASMRAPKDLSGSRSWPSSALPDAEANVIRNLMERIDQLENQVGTLQSCLRAIAAGQPINDVCAGASQNLKDREILEFLGE